MTLDSFECKFDNKKHSILLDLYNYRALTTTQIKEKYFANSNHYVDKFLYKMRKQKLIKTSTLSKSRENKKGFSYHRITDFGLEILAEKGVDVEGRAFDIYVHPVLLTYLLEVNQIMVNLTPSGWKMWDSRKIKKEYNLDRNMLIHGMLISPDGDRYGIYYMAENSNKNILGKIQSEIRVYDSIINNFIIFAGGPNCYKEFLKRSINESKKRIGNEIVKQQPLNIGGELYLLPFAYGVLMLKNYPIKKEWEKYLASSIGCNLIESATFNLRENYFKTTVFHNGEEKFLVDLIRLNISDIYKVNSYAANQYRWSKKKILVVNHNQTNIDIIDINNPYVEVLNLDI